MLPWKDYRTLLEHARKRLPEESQVVLLADRGFANRELMDWCSHQNWCYAIRLKCNQWIHFPDDERCQLRDLPLQPGAYTFLHDVHLGGAAYGPLDIAVAWNDDPDSDPWYIGTNRRADTDTLQAYARRDEIEHAFRDDKSGGFQFEDSRLVEPEHIDRLLLVMALAYLYFVSAGSWLVEQDLRRSIDSHWQRGLSYVKLGWRAIRRALHHGLSIPIQLHLLPGADPEPVPTAPPFRLCEFKRLASLPQPP